MIEIKLPKYSFAPSEIINGQVEWSNLNLTKRFEARLMWYTTGKGDCDCEVVDTRVMDATPPNGQLKFSFVAPVYPPSFSGKLISLIWAIELVSVPEGDCVRREIVVAPNGSEIVLHGN